LKATHEQIIILLKRMGWIEFDIFPDLNITIMVRGSEYMTVEGSNWRKGNYGK